jgi:hypothetical protein
MFVYSMGNEQRTREQILEYDSEDNVRVWTGDQDIDNEIGALIHEIAKWIRCEYDYALLKGFFRCSNKCICEKLKWLKQHQIVVSWYDPGEGEVKIDL